MYTDGTTTRSLAGGYLIIDNIEYIMHVWSDYCDKPAGKYNITVTPKAGGNAVYSFMGLNLILGGNTISDFRTVIVGQYAGAESIEHTLDNVVFANALLPAGTVVIIK